MMRSITIARQRIASPARIPLPTAVFYSARSISLPNPRAPISDAMTTIDRNMGRVWLTQAVIDVRATGRSTSKSRKWREAPNASAVFRKRQASGKARARQWKAMRQPAISAPAAKRRFSRNVP